MSELVCSEHLIPTCHPKGGIIKVRKRMRWLRSHSWGYNNDEVREGPCCSGANDLSKKRDKCKKTVPKQTGCSDRE